MYENEYRGVYYNFIEDNHPLTKTLSILTARVQTRRLIPGKSFSHSKPSQPKAPNAPIAKTPCGWQPVR